MSSIWYFSYLCFCFAVVLYCMEHYFIFFLCVTFGEKSTLMIFRRTVSLAPNRREWHHHTIRHGQYTQTQTHTWYIRTTNRNMTLENLINTFPFPSFWKLMIFFFVPSPNSTLCLCVCYIFHTNHSMLSVLQSNTSVPRGFPLCLRPCEPHYSQMARIRIKSQSIVEPVSWV